MDNNLCWTSSSKKFEKQPDHDLTMLVGQWSASPQVKITRPEVISRGSIRKIEIDNERQKYIGRFGRVSP